LRCLLTSTVHASTCGYAPPPSQAPVIVRAALRESSVGQQVADLVGDRTGEEGSAAHPLPGRKHGAVDLRGGPLT
jgi:hypothetical protein